MSKRQECGAWVGFPGKRAKVKCARGKHRGNNHSFSYEFHVEEGDFVEKDQQWQTATLTWRS